MDQNRPRQKPRKREDDSLTHKVVTYSDRVGSNVYKGFALFSNLAYNQFIQNMSRTFVWEPGFLNHRVAKARTLHDPAKPGSVIHIPAIDIPYTSYEDLRNCMRLDLITEEQAKVLVDVFFEDHKDIFGRKTYRGFYGHFPAQLISDGF